MPRIIGETICERYEVLKCIAQGRTAHVFAAIDHAAAVENAVERFCALKFPLPELRQAEPLLRRFLQEGALLAKCQHKNILRFQRYGDYGGLPFLVTEYVVGERLDHWRPASPLSGPTWPDIARLGKQIAWALQHIHDQGVVHGDIKPSNIIITKDGTAKLLDFGSARDKTQHDTGQALNGFTPQYATRERQAGETAEPADDIHALACLIHRLALDRGGAQHSEKPAGMGDAAWQALNHMLAPTRSAQPSRAADMLDLVFKE